MKIRDIYKIIPKRYISDKRGLNLRVRAGIIHDDTHYSDPSNIINKYLKVNLFNNKIFQPDIKLIENSQHLFTDSENNQIRFLTYALSQDMWPDYGYPEISFMGETNCGKSSLIKSIFSQAPKLKVKISKKPGKTKTMHFFLCGSNFALVDFPGYGYKKPDHYKESVLHYLMKRDNLRCSFHLLCNAKLSEQDKLSLTWLDNVGLPFAVIFTKIDSYKTNDFVFEVLKIYKEIHKLNLKMLFPHIFLTSAETGGGMDYLRTFIALTTAPSSAFLDDNVISWLNLDTRFR